MTVEEYSEGLKRYFETTTGRKREKVVKSDDCTGYGFRTNCTNCIFNNTCGNVSLTEKAEILEKWLKEHPVVTNGQHFIDEFGFDGYTCEKVRCNETHSAACKHCQYSKNAEYKKSEDKHDN